MGNELLTWIKAVNRQFRDFNLRWNSSGRPDPSHGTGGRIGRKPEQHEGMINV
jgi:hypothetical protein